MYKPGDEIFFIESNRIVRDATIVRVTGDSAIIRFPGGGGTRISLKRIFESKMDAEASLKPTRDAMASERGSILGLQKPHRTHHDWDM